MGTPDIGTGLEFTFDGTGATIVGLGTYESTALVIPVLVSADIEGDFVVRTVIAIGTGAFQENTAITNLSFAFGSQVTTIGVNAFRDCTGLTSVTFTPGSVLATIGATAFQGCTNLSGSVVFPDSLTTIGAAAFYLCSGLTGVTFPANLTTIGGNAFNSCIGLTSVAIPYSLTTIGQYAFGFCTGLTSVTFAGGYSATYNTTAFIFSGINYVEGTTKGIPTFTTTDLDSWNTPEGAGYFLYQTLTESSPPCFAEGTRILTQHGYKAIETLDAEDRVVTADLRIVPFNLFKTATLAVTSKKSAPYLIQRHAFGRNLPAAPIQLSPDHKIQIGAGRWLSAKMAARSNPLVTQCDLGAPVTYYQIECENYFKDNLVAEGLVVESYGTIKATGGKKDLYTWNEELQALTRPADFDRKFANKSA